MQFLIIPVAYLICIPVLFAIGRRRGLAVSLLFFALAVTAGGWAIMQSRSSTAALGLIFLPFSGVLAGVLGWMFRNLQQTRHAALRLLAWACLAAACTVVALEVHQGVQNIELNRSRDALQQAHALRIERNRAMIAAALKQHPGREQATIEALIREYASDPEMVLPALESAFVSADTLDRLAGDGDLGIALTAVRNPNCRADTLARIYRTHAYPAYFFQALAAHPHTPPEILRELRQKQNAIAGLDVWFARNPATPADVLLDLTHTRDVNVIQGLLQNPNLDCSLLGRTEAALQRSARPGDSYSTARLRELRPRLCAAAAPAG